MSKPDQKNKILEFGRFRLDSDERLLSADGKPVSLTPKVFDLLVVLARNPGRLLDKESLLTTLWPETFVEEANLSVNISTLRRALDAAGGENYIETVPKRGYRFTGEVRELTPKPVEKLVEKPPEEPAAPPPKRGRGPRRWPLAIAGALFLAGCAVLWIRSLDSVSGVRSLAILPFRPLVESPRSSPGEREDLLALGMADAVIRKLSSLQKIKVRATSSVQKYAGPQRDAQAAGRELRVDMVLDSTVQHDNKMIRVSVQLLRVADGSAIWTDRFDDYYTNIFQVQDSISEKVASALRMQLTQADRRKMTKHATQDTLAYQLYLKGKYCAMRRTADSPSQVCALLFERATEKDPEYGLAYSGLADMYMEIASMEANPEATQKARVAADKAIGLDDNSPEAHLARGNVLFRGDWDWLGAEREFDRALALDANSSLAHWNMALLLMALGHKERALSEMTTAQLLDPASVNVRDDLGWAFYCNRRYDEAIRESKAATEMGEQSYAAHHQLGKAYLHSGKFREAIGEFETTVKMHFKRRGLADLGQAFAMSGNLTEARKVLAELRGKGEDKTYEEDYMRAVLEAAMGDRDAAFASLAQAVTERLSRAIWILTDPDLDPLRNDPRFSALLRDMRLPD